MNYRQLILLVVLAFLLVGWSNNAGTNTPVCTAPGNQLNTQMCVAKFGGTIITWEDSRGADKDIYVQYLDASGKIQWKLNGIAACGAEGDQEEPQIVSDGAGGAIIAWIDKRNGNKGKIYAQRVDTSGAFLWGKNGTPVCAQSGEKYKIRMILNSDGNPVLAWWDKRDGNEYHLYAQCLNKDGKHVWEEDGVVACDVSGSFYEAWIQHDLQTHDLTPGESSGVIITWMDVRRNNDADIYAQNLNGMGHFNWIYGGLPICTANLAQSSPRIVPGRDREYIIAWIDSRPNFQYSHYDWDKIYTQRVDFSGNILDRENGVRHYEEYSWIYDFQMVSDGKGGAVLVWSDEWFCTYYFTYGSIIESMHLSPADLSGVSSPANVIDRTLQSGSREKSPRLVLRKNGSALISYLEKAGDNYDLFAGIDNFTIKEAWSIPIATGTALPRDNVMAGDGAGGAVMAWADKRAGHYNIYAQNVCDGGGIGDCSAPVALIHGEKFGGLAPRRLNFDGSQSYDPDGQIKRWRWDFGDGEIGYGEQISHTYHNAGLFWLELRVKDNNGRWSTTVKKPVFLFDLGDIEAKFEMDTAPVKAYGDGVVGVNLACYETDTDPGREERPVPSDLGVKLVTDFGNWNDEQSFASGYYRNRLLSGQPGTATIKAMLDGKVLAETTIEFAWPKAPANVQVELKENRSLFSGVYYAHISWQANPNEVFTPAHYRVYGTEDGGEYILTAEVDASTFSLVVEDLPHGKNYSFAVTMVDSDGDESFLPGAEPRISNLSARYPKSGL